MELFPVTSTRSAHSISVAWASSASLGLGCASLPELTQQPASGPLHTAGAFTASHGFKNHKKNVSSHTGFPGNLHFHVHKQNLPGTHSFTSTCMETRQPASRRCSPLPLTELADPETGKTIHPLPHSKDF